MFDYSHGNIIGALLVGLAWLPASYKTQICSLSITLSYCWYRFWMDKGRNCSLFFFLVVHTSCLHALDPSGLLNLRLSDIKEFLNQTTITINQVGLELFQIFSPKVQISCFCIARLSSAGCDSETRLPDVGAGYRDEAAFLSSHVSSGKMKVR